MALVDDTQTTLLLSGFLGLISKLATIVMHEDLEHESHAGGKMYRENAVKCTSEGFK